VTKAWFWFSFSSLGVFWAEVISNSPLGLINPILLIAYGTIYVLFADACLKSPKMTFRNWWIYGFLLGIITETFVAKVTFYGLSPAEIRILGLSPGAILFIIGFYHVFISWMIPCYLGRWLFEIPFPLKITKLRTIAVFSSPILLSPFHYACIVNRKWDLTFFASQVFFCALILLIILIILSCLRWKSPIINISLSSSTRKKVLFFTVCVYLFFLLNMTNPAHGHLPKDIPPWPFIFICLIIFLLCHYNLRQVHSVKYIFWKPASIKICKTVFWLIWHVGSSLLMLNTYARFPALSENFILAIALSGIIFSWSALMLSCLYKTSSVN
jgi:hypothetical protein